jgi:exopolyphosphatase/guanosine-5'-triphosphate,3'-diphosphate pyrophosphatase
MKLAAIDIGTNSIHMVIVKVTKKRSFEVIDREKEMVKLGSGVFATKRLNDSAFEKGLETIRRYVQLADQYGVDEIITGATSAIREAQNGGEFLDEVIRQTGIAPEVISGGKEARLIFLAVRHAIALQGENALVIDIGGGSTEVVLGNDTEILFGKSMKLGVLRLLDMFERKATIGGKNLRALEAHIQSVAQSVMEEARAIGFTRVIGTSGTIRTLGEAAHLAAGGKPFRTINAEVVPLSNLEKLSKQLLTMPPEKRASISGISEIRTDAIHLGGVLLVKLLQMANVNELTLCEASLREGLVLDYLERHAKSIDIFPEFKDLRHRSVAQLAHQFEVDWEQTSHVARLSLQIFDQTQALHGWNGFQRDILEFAALLHSVGQHIRFRSYHKHSCYIIENTGMRGFNDEEVLLIGQVVRYHRKSPPKKKHKTYKMLSKEHRHMVQVLSGILRIAVALDRTKNQAVRDIRCEISDKQLNLQIKGGDTGMELELWTAMRHRQPLAKALDRKLKLTLQKDETLINV